MGFLLSFLIFICNNHTAVYLAQQREFIQGTGKLSSLTLETSSLFVWFLSCLILLGHNWFKQFLSIRLQVNEEGRHALLSWVGIHKEKDGDVRQKPIHDCTLPLVNVPFILSEKPWLEEHRHGRRAGLDLVSMEQQGSIIINWFASIYIALRGVIRENIWMLKMSSCHQY